MTMMPFIDLKTQYETLKPQIDKAMAEVLTDGRYIMGPPVAELEKRLGEYTGAAEVIACANGTDALWLPLIHWGLGPGQAVFCPAFTFIATAEVVRLSGATPVFVDIDPVTFNMSPAHLQSMIDKTLAEGRLKPAAVIAVDLFGLPCDYEAIGAIAAQHGLKLLEDAAQGFGGEYKNRRAGSFGQAAGTSFFPAKPLGCYGDGGAIFTNDKDLALALRQIRAHGTGAVKYEHVRLGVNSRLDSLQAAILLVKLAAFPQELEKRQKAALVYEELLGGHVQTPKVPQGYLSSWAQYTIKVAPQKRDGLMKTLNSQGIPTAVYYPIPLHLQKAFADLGGAPGDLPHSEQAAAGVFSLPMHPYLTRADQQKVAKTLLEALN